MSATTDNPCTGCENPCSKYGQCPPEILKEIDQGSMVGSVEKHRRHICIGQSVPTSQWPKDVKDLDGRYVAEIQRVLKEKKEAIGYAVKLTSASVVTSNVTENPMQTGDWYIFPDQLKLTNVKIEQVEQVIQTLLVEDQSVIKIKDQSKSIEEQLKQESNLPNFDGNIHCERLRGLWILVCCHYQRDQRCGVIGPMLVDVVEKYSQEINRTDDVHALKISHIGGHKFAGNVIVYPSGTWYGRVLPENIPSIIDAYLSSSDDLKSKLKPLYRGQLDSTW